MVSPLTFATLVAVAAFLLALVAERMHAARVRRIAGLAFGASARPRAWVALAAPARVVAATAIAWALAILLNEDPRESAARGGEPRHLVIALDVSPSMTITDAGADGAQTRGERARDLVRSALERLDRGHLLVSVIAFYSGAKPVVVDTIDPEVVGNVLADLPLEYAFEVGKTRMYDGVACAAEIAKTWRPGSAAFMLVSDGDTLPATAAPVLPPAFTSTMVIGVGDCARGTMIADHASHQDAASLRQLASRLHGRYHDGNARHLPSSELAGFAVAPAQPLRTGLAWWSLWALGVGATVEAVLPLALIMWGSTWPSRSRPHSAADAPARFIQGTRTTHA